MRLGLKLSAFIVLFLFGSWLLRPHCRPTTFLQPSAWQLRVASEYAEHEATIERATSRPVDAD